MRSFVIAVALIASAVPAGAFAQAKYSTSETLISKLVADPAAKAVIEKHIPGFADNAPMDMVGSQTLKGLQGMAPDRITDKLLADMDADLSKLPAK